MNKVLSMILLVLSANSWAYIVPTFPGQNTHYKSTDVFVCGTTYLELLNCPDDLSDSQLLQRAKTKVLSLTPFTDNPGCDLNPSDPTCSNGSGLTHTTGALDYIIFNLQSNSLVKKRVSFSPDPAQFGGIRLSITTVQALAADNALLRELKVGESILDEISQEMTFLQREDGSWFNIFGDSPTEVATEHGFHWNGEFGCKTATDWLGGLIYAGQNRSCRENVSNFIDGIAQHGEAAMNLFPQWIENLTIDFGAISSELTTGIKELPFPMAFEDGSFIAIMVKPSENRYIPPQIRVEYKNSRSTTKENFDNFIAKAKNRRSMEGIPAAEAANYSILMNEAGISNCTFNVALWNHAEEYTIDYPDGPKGEPRVTIVSWQTTPKNGFIDCNPVANN